MKGGKRPGAGRPVGSKKVGTKEEQVLVRLTKAQRHFAELLGNGNAAEGLRQALEMARK